MFFEFIGIAHKKSPFTNCPVKGVHIILRDDGVTYQDYVTELTYILFLKMSKEQDQEKDIPPQYWWDEFLKKEGEDLKEFYKQMFLDLGNPKKTASKKLNAIYADASTSIDEPANLKKIIDDIDALDWFSAKEEGLGNMYEGLLEKNASEIKSGAGRYFTPRPLINMMVKMMNPKVGERLCEQRCLGLIQYWERCA